MKKIQLIRKRNSHRSFIRFNYRYLSTSICQPRFPTPGLFPSFGTAYDGLKESARQYFPIAISEEDLQPWLNGTIYAFEPGFKKYHSRLANMHNNLKAYTIQ